MSFIFCAQYLHYHYSSSLILHCDPIIINLSSAVKGDYKS